MGGTHRKRTTKCRKVFVLRYIAVFFIFIVSLIIAYFPSLSVMGADGGVNFDVLRKTERSTTIVGFIFVFIGTIVLLRSVWAMFIILGLAVYLFVYPYHIKPTLDHMPEINKKNKLNRMSKKITATEKYWEKLYYPNTSDVLGMRLKVTLNYPDVFMRQRLFNPGMHYFYTEHKNRIFGSFNIFKKRGSYVNNYIRFPEKHTVDLQFDFLPGDILYANEDGSNLCVRNRAHFLLNLKDRKGSWFFIHTPKIYWGLDYGISLARLIDDLPDNSFLKNPDFTMEIFQNYSRQSLEEKGFKECKNTFYENRNEEVSCFCQ